MIFNSIDFLLFFIIFLSLFYFANNIVRKYLIFIASAVFYMWFIPQYIIILYITILIDYFAALKIESAHTQKQKKLHLLLGIINTCVVLFVFKYFNFFIDNLKMLGIQNVSYWNIILPIGLSFHVFQSLSYVIEVYRGNTKAEKNILDYANFVMFFPQLVAGPIERANNLLPQLKGLTHKITYAQLSAGFNLFVWGLFKKVVVADNIAQYVNATYGNYEYHVGATLLLSTLLFAFQIYADFSGYSDMAIGIAKMMGIYFNINFGLPYFATSITDFWRRWHISLSSWLRDYLYISFGGNKKGKWKTYRNLMLTMLIGGLWHGASWNFVIWGGINGLYLAIEKLTHFDKWKPKNIISQLIASAVVFLLISFSWLFFRAETFSQATSILHKIVFNFNVSKIYLLHQGTIITIAFSILVLLGFEIYQYRKKLNSPFQNTATPSISMSFSKETIILVFFLTCIILFGNSDGNQFIYFQF